MNTFIRSILSIILGIVISGIVLAIVGYNPIHVYVALITGIFASPQYMGYALSYSAPLILTGLSVSFAFRTGLFNIGAEGQYEMGVIGTSMVGAYLLPLHLNGAVGIILLLIIGFFIGFIWGGIAGLLKAYFGINEVVTTIMLNWIALYFNNYMVLRFQKGDSSMTHSLPTQFRFPLFSQHWLQSHSSYLAHHPQLAGFAHTPVSWSILGIILVAVLFYVILNRTVFGYNLKAVGFSRHAAEYAGVNVKLYTFLAMAIAGGIASLAGTMQVMGVPFYNAYVLSGGPEGYGNNGIAVALIGGSAPIGNILGGLFLGSFLFGAQNVQSLLGVPSEIIKIMIGLIVFFLAIPIVFKTTMFKIWWNNLKIRKKFKKSKGGL